MKENKLSLNEFAQQVFNLPVGEELLFAFSPRKEGSTYNCVVKKITILDATLIVTVIDRGRDIVSYDTTGNSSHTNYYTYLKDFFAFHFKDYIYVDGKEIRIENTDSKEPSKIYISYWHGSRYKDLKYEHKEEMEYFKERVLEIAQDILSKGYHVALNIQSKTKDLIITISHTRWARM